MLTSCAVTRPSPQHCGDFQPAARNCNFHGLFFLVFFFFPLFRCPRWGIYRPLSPIPDPKVRCWLSTLHWHSVIFLEIYIFLLTLPFVFSLLKTTLHLCCSAGFLCLYSCIVRNGRSTISEMTYARLTPTLAAWCVFSPFLFVWNKKKTWAYFNVFVSVFQCSIHLYLLVI